MKTLNAYFGSADVKDYSTQIANRAAGRRGAEVANLSEMAGQLAFS